MTTLEQPLCNYEAEQTIIGALLKDPHHHLCRQAMDCVSESSFYSIPHKKIYSTIKTRYENKEDVSLITVTDELERKGVLENCGGFVYVAEMIKNTISNSNIIALCELVSELSSRRDLISMAQEVIEQSSYMKTDELLSLANGAIKDISNQESGKKIDHLSHFGDEWIDDFDKKQKQRSRISGLETGIEELDNKIGGFDEEGLIIVAGRPSMGKTLFAQEILDFVGIQNKKPCTFFSMEMSGSQVYGRFVSKNANISPEQTRGTVKLDDGEWGRLTESTSRIIDSAIYVDVDQRLAVEQIRARVRRQISIVGKQALIVVDYLGLMKKPKADRHDIAIGEITAALKSLAKEIKTPIMLLVQANRDLDKAKRPTMSNLKDSSSIEADADVVIFVHRDEVVNPDTELKGVTEIIIAKDRHNDGNGTVYLRKVNGGFEPISPQEVGMLEHQESVKQKATKGFAKQNKQV